MFLPGARYCLWGYVHALTAKIDDGGFLKEYQSISAGGKTSNRNHTFAMVHRTIPISAATLILGDHDSGGDSEVEAEWDANKVADLAWK
jgi:hypothetical protein